MNLRNDPKRLSGKGCLVKSQRSSHGQMQRRSLWLQGWLCLVMSLRKGSHAFQACLQGHHRLLCAFLKFPTTSSRMMEMMATLAIRLSAWTGAGWNFLKIAFFYKKVRRKKCRKKGTTTIRLELPMLSPKKIIAIGKQLLTLKDWLVCARGLNVNVPGLILGAVTLGSLFEDSWLTGHNIVILVINDDGCGPSPVYIRPRWSERLLPETQHEGMPWISEDLLELVQGWARLIRNLNSNSCGNLCQDFDELFRVLDCDEKSYAYIVIIVIMFLLHFFVYEYLLSELLPCIIVPTQMHTSFAGSNDDRPTFSFLGRIVGRACLCDILAIGINRLRKCIQLVPDLRLGKDKGGSRQNTRSVDAFLSILYSSVAETLPDKSLGSIFKFVSNSLMHDRANACMAKINIKSEGANFLFQTCPFFEVLAARPCSNSRRSRLWCWFRLLWCRGHAWLAGRPRQGSNVGHHSTRWQADY